MNDALAALVTLAMVFVPGLGVSLAIWGPGDVSIPTRLATGAALGFVFDGAIAFLLAVGHVFHAATFFPAWAAVTIGAWALAWRRGPPSEHGRALAAQLRGDPLPLWAGLAVMLAFAVLRLTYSPQVHLWNATSWRYWADGVEIAAVGRIPTQTIQYGALASTIVNKVLLNAASGGLRFAIGPEALLALGALLWVASVGLAVSVWSLGWELGLRLTAPLLPVLLVANGLVLNRELTSDLQAYKAELVGRVVAFCAAAVAVRALQRPHRWRDALAAGALLGAAATIHIVPVMIAAIVIGWFAVARVLIERSVLRVVFRGVAVAAVAGALGLGILLLSGGDAAIGGASSDEAASAAFGPRFDPTLFLKEGVDVAPSPGPHPWYVSPLRAAKLYTASALGISFGSSEAKAVVPLAWILGIGGAAGAAVLMVRGQPSLRAIGVVSIGLALTIVALAWLMSYRALYVPATFGLRRLFDYSAIPVVLAVLTVIEIVLGRFAGRSTGTVRVATVALTVVVAAVLLPSARSPAFPAGTNAGLVQAFDWIRGNLPCDARILADQHTEGVFEAMTGRVAILEGATPYLRPDVLPGVIRLLEDAGDFFRDPAGHAALLARERVTAVVIIKEGVIGYPVTANERADDRSGSCRITLAIHASASPGAWPCTANTEPRKAAIARA